MMSNQRPIAEIPGFTLETRGNTVVYTPDSLAGLVQIDEVGDIFTINPNATETVQRDEGQQ